jgi:hypothetical protein
MSRSQQETRRSSGSGFSDLADGRDTKLTRVAQVQQDSSILDGCPLLEEAHAGGGERGCMELEGSLTADVVVWRECGRMSLKEDS